jgi:hypothetical protein
MLFLVALLASALGMSLQRASTGDSAANGLSRHDLQNLTYHLGTTSSVEGGKVPLTDGRWSDPAGGSSFTLHPTHALGDLDGDRRGDAAAILVESTGGTGTFYYLFAVVNRDGRAVQIGEPEWLGDRTVIERLSIDRKGLITIRFLTHKDSDAACCPTMRIEDRYRVEGGRLVGILK